MKKITNFAYCNDIRRPMRDIAVRRRRYCPVLAPPPCIAAPGATTTPCPMNEDIRLFLVDAYALIYRSYYALIRNPLVNSKGMNTSAVMGFCKTLFDVMRREKPTHIAVAFDSGAATFRRQIYPPYKAQREATPEDIRASVPVIRDILAAMRITVLQADGYEADDIIGTVAGRASARGITVCMLTPDKDYAQLTTDGVMMYRPRHGGGYEVLDAAGVCDKYGIASPRQVIDMLGLMGDASDNIPGCPGVGEKTAVRLINMFGDIETMLRRTDELKGVLKTRVETNAEQIRLSKMLATIKTDVPMDIDIDAMAVRSADMTALRRLFAELEFRIPADRIPGTEAAAQSPAEPDLFAAETAAEPAAEPATAAADDAASPLETVDSRPHSYTLVTGEDAMLRLRDYLLASPLVSMDTETTSTHAVDARLVGLSFAVREGEAFYVPVDDDNAGAVIDIFRPVYADAAVMKVGQNIKYDIEVLMNYGVEVAGELWDTMIAHYLLQPEQRHNMDYMAEVYLRYKTIHIDELIGPKGKEQRSMREVDPAVACVYAAEDADVTLRLKNVLEPQLERYGLTRLFREIEMPLVPVLADMEMQGVRIDTQALADISADLTARMHETEEAVCDLAGERFNIASPRQVGDILFGKLKITDKPKKTKTGQYVTSEEVLQQLKGKHPIVNLILAHRALKKLIGTYVDALPKLVNPRTGHIHTSFNQAVTATGRLSSSEPNLQNIPVRGEDGREIRRAFVPEPGCLFFSADYSQIELRVMAHLSGDANMIEAFRQGHDIHLATAARIYKKEPDDVTHEERTRAKRANFGIIYGITVFGLAERLGIARDEARSLIDGYFSTFPDVETYMEQSKDTARRQGYVTTMYGRRRRLPDINSRNATVRGFAERNAVNAPIQGTAADIIKVAMVRIYRRFKSERLKSKMILQVHDELNFSVVPSERQRVQTIVIEEMEHACTLAVPLIADSGFGNNWLEAH